MARALGLLPAVFDDKVMSLRAIGRQLDRPPAESNWYASVGDWPMLDNDQIGDCLPVAVLHLIQQRCAYTGKAYAPTAKEARDLYKRWNPGWIDKNVATDTGCLLSSSLAAWYRDGIELSTGLDKPEAYAYVDHLSIPWIQTAIARFGHVIIGIECPTVWTLSDYLLDLPTGMIGEIAGGHGVLLTGYQPTRLGTEYATITWGGRFAMTERALQLVCREAFVVMDWDFYDAVGHDPAGFDRDEAAKLMASMQQSPVRMQAHVGEQRVATDRPVEPEPEHEKTRQSWRKPAG